jgi:hypothetical protein
MTVKSIVPKEISDAIGWLPVLECEDKALYWSILERVGLEIGPKDLHEWFQVKTMVDCDWQNLRYERIKMCAIDRHFQEALANVLRPILEEETIEHSREQDALELARDWFTDCETNKAIRRHLSDYNLSYDSVLAEAMRLCGPQVNQLQQLIESNERRRNFAYRDLEFYREGKRIHRLAEPKTLTSV